MCEDMRALLNAYLDGELSGWRLLQVQNHLASCASCREELRELRTVSDLLHAAPAPEFVPAERFVANLTLNLPRRPITAHLKRGPTLAWWLAPAIARNGQQAGALLYRPAERQEIRRAQRLKPPLAHCR